MQRSARKLVHPFLAVFAIAVACNGDSPPGSDDPASAWSGDDPTTSTSAAVKPALTVPANTILADTAGVLSPTASGTLTVDDRGQAHSHIPIWVPPGRAGIQPALSLEYTSGGANGPVGVGWGLAGLSRITRCPNLRKNGNVAPPILWAVTDTFCLDGEPLVSDSDHYVYTKFDDDGTRIQWVRSGSADPGSWKLYTKDGRITTFGGTGDSKVVVTRLLPTTSTFVMAWAESRVEDRAGNYMSATYGTSGGGDIQPTEIDYTGSATDVPMRSLKFVYEARADVEQRVFAEQYFSYPQRLKRITMQAPNSAVQTPLRSFALGYTASGVTGRSLLKYIAECNGNVAAVPVTGSVRLCRQETLTYAPGTPLSAGNSYGITNVDTNGLAITDVTQSPLEGVEPNVHLLDVDGDGHDDLLYLSNDAAETYHLRLWKGTAFGPAIVTDIAAAIQLHQTSPVFGTSAPYVLDFNGDGHADVLVNQGTSANPNTRVYLANNASGSWTLGGQGYEYTVVTYGLTQVADLDGDGWPDLVMVNPNSTTGASYVLNRDGTNAHLSPPLPLPINRPDFVDSLTSMFLDVNNDGVTDVVTRQWSDSACVGHRYGDPQYACTCSKIGYAVNDIGNYLYDSYAIPNANDSLATDLTYCTGGLDTPSFFSQLYGDFNGDGLVDVIETNVPVPTQGGPNPNRNFQLSLGGGEYSWAKVTTGGSFSMGDSMYTYQTLDADGDGKTDLLVRGGGAGTPPGSQLNTIWSWKNGGWHSTLLLQNEVTGAISNDAFQMFATGDVDGDGQTDFVVFSPSGNLILYTRNAVTRADLLTDVSGDFVVSSGVKYQPYLVLPGEDRSDCRPPISCVTRGGLVVSELDVADGAGGELKQFHSYTSGRADRVGWGFLGFKTHTIVETAGTETVSTTIRKFDFTENTAGATPFFPLLGKPVEVDTTVPYQNGTQAVTRTTISTTDYTVQGTGPFMALPHTTTTTTTDSNTSDTIASTITTRLYDAYGNMTNEYVQWPLDLEKKVTAVQYLYDTNNWFISLPTFVTTTSTTNVNIGGGTSVVRQTAYAYDGLGQLVLQTESPGAANTSGGYDPLPTQTDGVQTLYTRTTRDPHGLPKLVEKLDNLTAPVQRRATAFAYDTSEGMFVVQTTDPVGLVTQAAYEPGLGVVAAQTDPAGTLTTFQYDTFGRIRADHPAAGGGRTVVYQAASSSDLGSIVDHRSGQYSKTSTLDLLRRTIVETITGRADGKAVSTETMYDGLGRVHLATRPHFTNVSTGTTTTTYDMLNRPVKVAGADGSVVTTAYVGLQVTTTNADSNLTRVTNDTQGRPVYSEQATTTGTQGLSGHTTTTSLTYGPFGTLASTIDSAGNEVDMTYDRLGRLLWKRDLDTAVTAYAYDVFGEIVDQLRGASLVTIFFGGKARQVVTGGNETTMTYDGDGRMTDKHADDVEQTFTYDTARLGKLTSATVTGGTTITYAYDTFGNVKSKKWSGPRGSLGYAYAYDTYNRLLTTTYPAPPSGGGAALVLKNLYSGADLGGQLTGVNDNATNTPYWSLKSTDASEQFSVTDLRNGVETTLGEDLAKRGWLKTVTSKVGTNTVEALNYVRGYSGRVQERDDTKNGTTELYGYDGLERLTSWAFAATLGTRSVLYAYDDLGNLTDRTVLEGPGTTVHYTYGGTAEFGPHQVSGDGSSTLFAYDGQGNQLVSPGRSFVWNTFDRMTSTIAPAGTYTMTYDADLARFSRKDPAGHTRYSYGGLYDEFTDTTGTHVVMTVAAAGHPVTEIEKVIKSGALQSTTISTVLVDAIGSVDALVSAAGVATPVKYDAFGARLKTTDPAVRATVAPQNLRIGFTGHNHDDDVDLIDMIGRVYDPVQQRFLSIDPPAPASLVDSQAYNPYAYVRNNPLNSTDPTGYETVEENSSASKKIYGMDSSVFYTWWYRAMNPYGASFWQAAVQGTDGTSGTDSQQNADGFTGRPPSIANFQLHLDQKLIDGVMADVGLTDERGTVVTPNGKRIRVGGDFQMYTEYVAACIDAVGHVQKVNNAPGLIPLFKFWLPVNDLNVRDIIARALVYAKGDIGEAHQWVNESRAGRHGGNPCDSDLAAAEHYFLARTQGTYVPAPAVDLVNAGYMLLKTQVSGGMRIDDGPISPPSLNDLRWMFHGAYDAAHPESPNSWMLGETPK